MATSMVAPRRCRHVMGGVSIGAVDQSGRAEPFFHVVWASPSRLRVNGVLKN
jgi:hypothetical protein